MAITYGFFNSVNGDRLYNADDISNYFLKLISNGVFATPANSMQVQAGSGMTVNVSAGWGFINCKWLNNDSAYSLTLDAADIVLHRIDRIVLRLNADSTLRNMEIAVKKGASAANPQPPSLTRVSGGVWELSLARIDVFAGATEITQANIYDERADTSVCGWVTGLIDQIDTTNLFAQYNAAFSEWFETVKETLATKTMIQRYQSTYTTTTASVNVIPINIPEYVDNQDILNVFVNGLKLTPGIDYTASGSAGTIYLTKALDVIGTPVEIEVLKSIDGSDAESVVGLVYELQQEIAKIDRNTYYCNGVTDTTGLTAFIANWEQGQNSKDIIRIVGTFGADRTYTASDGNPYNFVYEGTGQPITLDFSDCDTIAATGNNFAYFSGCKVRGLNINFPSVSNSAAIIGITLVNASADNCRVSGTLTGSANVTAYSATGSRLDKCGANLTGGGVIYGIQADGSIVTRCNVSVETTSTSSSAYGVQISDTSRCDDSDFSAVTASTVTTGTACGGIGGGYYSNCQFIGSGGVRGHGFYVQGGQLLNANNCIFRGYTKDTSAGWGLGITGAGNSATTLILTGINCNQIAQSGYSQTGSMSFSDGYGSYMGCFYAAPTVPSTVVSYGSFVRNRV